MGLDIRTIALVAGALSAVQAVSVFVFTKIIGKQAGVDQYAYGNTGFSIGLILTLFRGQIPDFFSIVLSNTIVAISAYIIFDGACAYTRRTLNRKPLLLVPAGIFLSFLYFTYVDRDINVRSILISAAAALFSLLCSYVLFAFTRKELRQSSWFTASVLLVYGLSLLLRAVLTIAHPLPESGFAQNDVQVIGFLTMMLAGLLWSIGFVMMMVQMLLNKILLASMTDYLTGILNRQAGQEFLEMISTKSRKERKQFSILMVDIDHFKKVNDQYGHAAGDFTLKRISVVLRSRLRPQDVLSRWGGEEFLIILPGVGSEDARVVAERMRKLIAETQFSVEDAHISCTISIGISGCWGEWVETEEALARADRSLYAAKEAGRNRVVVSPAAPRVLSPTLGE